MRFPQLLTPAEKRLAVLLFVLTVIGSGLRVGRGVSPTVERWLSTGAVSDHVAPGRDTASVASPAESLIVRPDAPDAELAARHEIEPSGINPNTAEKAVLITLPGIGPALANRIVEDRTMNGPYRSAEDLLRVRGIGPATLRNIRSRLAF
jgi:competence protein ComEA